jgi:hypothetical protein
MLGALAVAGLVLVSAPVHAEVCGSPLNTPLIAGQSYPAGAVWIFNDASNIYVQYQTESPWVISDAHAAVASTLAGIPQTKAGNPIPGRFAYSATFDPEVTNYTFVIPAAGYTAGQTIFVAAHAMVHAPKGFGGSQTGWAFGPEFPGANWATYVMYEVQSCGGGGGPD